MGRLAILGGTGPEGLGLALRFAAAGEEIVIGSRDAARAAAAARRVKDAVPDARIDGLENASALAAAPTVFLAFPFEGAAPFLETHGAGLAGKLIVDVTNPLVYGKGRFRLSAVPEGSAAEMIQSRLPANRVVGAFKHQSAEELQRLERPAEGDVLVCGNDPDARAAVIALANKIPHLRGIDAGPLETARYLEGITALLLNLNKAHRATTSVRVTGLDSARH